jgi:hypothetical protein
MTSSNGANQESEGFPLYPLLNEVNKAASSGMPFLAISMAVALPDICAALSSPDGRTTGDRYKDWCRDNLGDEFNYVTPDDLYSMRCGVLHQGRFGGMKHSVARVIFFLPGGPATFTNCKLNDAYAYSVVDFCKNMADAVYRWCEKHKNDQTVQANIPLLMQYRATGFPPYVQGITVLA